MTRVLVGDVAIAGAGPAGAATAIALHALGVDDLLLLDGTGYARPPFGESLPPEARLLLERLGVWDQFVADRHDPCLGTCASWGGDGLGYNDFVLNPHGSGWHLDRCRFDARLVTEATARGAQLVPGRVARVERRPGGGFELRMGDGRPVRAGFVVDATGAAGLVGRALGGRRRVAHRLICAAALLRVPEHVPSTAMGMLEAVDYGWWYAARVPGHQVGVMVSTDARELRARSLHSADGWSAALRATRHVGPALAAARLEDSRVHVRTASSTALHPCAGEAWVAVGDAASTFDPIVAQGIYKALLDGLDAAAAVAEWRAGRPAPLNAYRSSRQARWEQYLALWERLYRLEGRWPESPFWARRRRLPAAC